MLIILTILIVKMEFNVKKTHLLIHKKSQYALETSDENLSKKSRTVEMGPVNPNNKRQLWLIEPKGEQAYEIINGFTDDVLTEEEKSLQLKRGTSSRYQLWSFEFLPNSDSQFYLRMAKFPNRYVYLHKGELRCQELVSPNTPDIWIFQSVQTNEDLNKSCFIISKDSKKLMDVPQASEDEGEEICLFRPNYRYNQRWNIFKAGEIYVIKSHLNGLNLDMKEQKFQNGTNIIQWPSHGKVNQFWMFEKVSQNEPEYRIFTCYDHQLELGHHNDRLVLHKGRKFTWIIEGYFPQ